MFRSSGISGNYNIKLNNFHCSLLLTSFSYFN